MSQTVPHLVIDLAGLAPAHQSQIGANFPLSSKYVHEA